MTRPYGMQHMMKIMMAFSLFLLGKKNNFIALVKENRLFLQWLLPLITYDDQYPSKHIPGLERPHQLLFYQNLNCIFWPLWPFIINAISNYLNIKKYYSFERWGSVLPLIVILIDIRILFNNFFLELSIVHRSAPIVHTWALFKKWF